MAAGGPFGTLLGNLNSLGFFQFLFPFLLVLAIVYGVLEFSIGGKEKRILPKSGNALIAIIVAFFVINYSGGVGSGMAVFFSQLFGSGMVIAVSILLILILIGLFGIKASDLHEKNKQTQGVVAIAGVVILIVFAIFVQSGSVIPGLSGLRLDQSSWTVIAFVVILIIVMWLLSRGGGEKSATG